MDEIAAETLKWITQRYGPVAFDQAVVASVPVLGGKAEGRGETKSEALVALYADLTGGSSFYVDGV